MQLKYFCCRIYENLPRIYFPVLWFEVAVQLPPFLVLPLKIFIHMPAILTAIGILLFLIGLIVTCSSIYRILKVNVKLSTNLALKEFTDKELEPLNSIKS